MEEVKKKRRKFNKEYLDECIKRDNAVLIGNYDTIKYYTHITFLCGECKTEHTKVFGILSDYTGAFCESCSIRKSREKAIITSLAVYGVPNPRQSDKVKEKAKKTNLERYGVEHQCQNKEIQEKVKKTLLMNYGVETPFKSDIIKKRIRDNCIKKYGVTHTSQLESVKEKTKQNNLNKYGVATTLLHKETKEKINNSMVELYGTTHALQNKELKKKAEDTIFKNYGVKIPLQNEEIKEKLKNTNLKKYGVEHVSQSTEIMEKTQKNAKKFKEYIMPSGAIRKVQGYEPFALDALLKEYTEDQILTNRKDVGRIPYKNGEKQCYYFPDIKIPHINKIIEVKSTWSNNIDKEINKLKGDAVKILGFEYEIWVFNSKGERVYE